MTRTVDAQDTVMGLSFPDPYRWLEDDSAEAEAWQRAQNSLTDAFVEGWPHLAALRAAVDRCVADGTGSANWMVEPAPRFAGGRWFRLDRTPAPDYPDRAALVVSDRAEGPGRVLYDPNHDGTRQISWITPAPDGRTVALGVCEGGSELGEIWLLDAETGARLPDRIPQPTMGPLVTPQWLPDSSGFFYTAGDLSAESFAFRVYFHPVGGEPATEPEPIEIPHGPTVQVAADGKYAVVTAVWPLPQYVCDLPDRSWRPFVQGLDASVVGVIDGDRYVAVTNHGAPRGRIVAIPFDAPAPSDPATWLELVPESGRVLGQVRLIGGRLAVTGSVDTEARAWVFDRDGRELEEVPLPGRGALPLEVLPTAAIAPDGHPDEFVFLFSTPTSSPGLYRYRLGSGQVDTLRAPRVNLPGATVSLRWARSADGTEVPYHLVLPGSVDSSRPLPTLVTAYGGGRVAWPAQFPGPVAAFVEAGGALVISHQRGGGDLGSDWADAGRLKHKQNSYDDLYAIAGHLVATGVTTPGRLAVTGWSNGGIMAGTAFAQRPDLWAAVVAQCPVLDIIGCHRHPYGRFAITAEFGDLGDPDDVARLAGMSPYQLVEDDVAYPALYVHAGGADVACPPGPTRKFIARAQAAKGATAPVLLRVWENVGHGTATSRSEGVTHVTHWLAFLMRRMGLVPRPS
ncbi:prolyl oligopeptidase family serine peptidase [Amycolatopsis nalaikhensis]|uniref:prolyl oligopeptidase n=1 Tax=Amycolatopsis nalaikhensis TaxID=715472 RepID=A0ABY8XEK6_9PSEU|nr:prolyl oligopeptidase family serine peptidase [Amycolatopsis sp. 2-2]WIV54054.1 prolyl oligopeptidase family serine peptidase [Amycolatopsis sp. 2-2]